MRIEIGSDIEITLSDHPNHSYIKFHGRYDRTSWGREVWSYGLMHVMVVF
jgi:hypothetical protein